MIQILLIRPCYNCHMHIGTIMKNCQ